MMPFIKKKERRTASWGGSAPRRRFGAHAGAFAGRMAPHGGGHGPSIDLRHDPAGRRAIAGGLADLRREDGDRAAARAPWRRRYRGRLSDLVAGRLRSRP